MPKVEVGYAEFVPQLVKAFGSGGALLTSVDADGRPNPMTIGWGTVGLIWSRNVFTVMVRPSRYTYTCIEHTGDFTVDLPYPQLRSAVDFCGTRSGRDYDKFQECDITPHESADITSPGIEECGVIWECDVMYHSDIDTDRMIPELTQMSYPGGDIHRVYYGLVKRCVADEDFASRFGP
mgnify:CR=1 FL=1